MVFLFPTGLYNNILFDERNAPHAFFVYINNMTYDNKRIYR